MIRQSKTWEKLLGLHRSDDLLKISKREKEEKRNVSKGGDSGSGGEKQKMSRRYGHRSIEPPRKAIPLNVPLYTRHPAPMDEETGIPITALHLGQDDPKKCSARKMARFGFARLEEKPERIRRGILLDPFAGKALSPADAGTARNTGLIVVDCSWKTAEAVFPNLRLRTKARALPYLVATNPVNFGHPFKLTSLEAVGAALYIMGARGQARRLMGLYKWAQHFLEINHEPLEEYASCRNSAEVVEAQRLFYDGE